MGEKYQDLSNLLNENMNLSQLLAIGEFASVRQNNLLNENISEWNADGQLFNKNIEQGGEGDCWFISFLYSASRHPEFIKAYSQNIEINNDEKTYTIKMRGKEYTYTFDQILYANEFSSGDMDVRVLEMAIRDFYAKELGSEMYNPMAQGGFMETAAYFFGIDEVQNILSVKNINNEFFDKYIELIKGKNCICTTSTTVENCEAIDMKSGKTITIDSYHELSLVDADDKYVYIVNPQDTKSELKLDIETFKANFEFYATDLSLLLEGINKYKK